VNVACHAAHCPACAQCVWWPFWSWKLKPAGNKASPAKQPERMRVPALKATALVLLPSLVYTWGGGWCVCVCVCLCVRCHVTREHDEGRWGRGWRGFCHGGGVLNGDTHSTADCDLKGRWCVRVCVCARALRSEESPAVGSRGLPSRSLSLCSRFL